MTEFLLTGPQGNNPLGFLTALGALATLDDAGHHAALGWTGLTPRLLVTFTQAVCPPPDPHAQPRSLLLDILYRSLRRDISEAPTAVEQAKKQMEQAQTALKKATQAIKRRKLDREAARQARQRELEPLKEVLRAKTSLFKRALIQGAPDPTVTLGKNLTASNAELLLHISLAASQSTPNRRRWPDLAAAFGLADPARPEDRMLASPWALISGSGHQDFLSTVQELMLQCTVEHLDQTLFGPWVPSDEKCSLRLDPADDRRYALMDRDPTAPDNKTRTLWGANRLAFEALRFFPAMPVPGGMGVRAWRAPLGDWQHGCLLRWPLWSPAVPSPVVHSLLGLPDLWLDEPAARNRLRALGVYTLMQSRRIAVGKAPNQKFNLTPAAPIWVSG